MKTLVIPSTDVTQGFNLTGVGRVNAICGVNSSGKSTLLRALSLSSPQWAIQPSAAPWENLLEESPLTLSEAPGTPQIERSDMIAQIADLARMESMPLLSHASIPTFVNNLADRVKMSYGRQILLNRDSLTTTILEFLGGFPQAILLDAKRQLTDEVDFTSQDGEFKNGQGVTVNLFRAQNSLTNNHVISQLEELKNAFHKVTAGIGFAIELRGNRLHTHFQFGNALVPAASCGLGLREALVTLYLAYMDGAQILLIEEPENHLHPTMQKALIRQIKHDTDKLVFFTTHSNSLLDSSITDQFYLTRFEANQILVREVTNKVEVLEALGYVRSDFLPAGVLVLVEGPGDEEVIQELLLIRFHNPAGKVVFQHLGGDNMGRVNVDHLPKVFDHVLAFVDQEIDSGSKKIRKQFQRKCADAGIECVISSKPCLEFYFPREAYEEVFPDKSVPVDFSHDQSISSQIGASPKGNLGRLARATGYEYLESTDLGQFVRLVAEKAGIRDAKAGS